MMDLEDGVVSVGLVDELSVEEFQCSEVSSVV